MGETQVTGQLLDRETCFTRQLELDPVERMPALLAVARRAEPRPSNDVQSKINWREHVRFQLTAFRALLSRAIAGLERVVQALVQFHVHRGASILKSQNSSHDCRHGLSYLALSRSTLATTTKVRPAVVPLSSGCCRVRDTLRCKHTQGNSKSVNRDVHRR